MDYKGYAARVEFDPEAGVLHGEVEGLRDVITFEATDVRELEAAFRGSVDDYLEQCKAEGVEPERPYSGKFLLRVEPQLHREVAIAAARAGRSLNAFASELLQRWIDSDRRSSASIERQVQVDSPANAIVGQVPLMYETPDVPSAVATARELVPVWRTATRDTPGSITPNTPPASRTPSRRRVTRAA